MSSTRQTLRRNLYPKTPDVADLQKSLYDADDTPEEDLWFLPPNPEDRAPTDMPVGARLASGAHAVTDLGTQDWLEAEAEAEASAGRLHAQAAAAFACYDERLSRLPGCEERIAPMCASSALEMQGDWMPAERIGLYVALRERSGEEAQILS